MPAARFRTTLSLFILLVAVSAYFFLVEQRNQRREMRSRALSSRILPYGPASVAALSLLSPDGDRFVIVRDGEGWKIVHPTVTPGSQSTIDLILRETVPGQILDFIPGVSRMADFGLDPPYAVLVLTTEGGRRDTINVGDKTPTMASCYVRIGSSDTVLVAREMTKNVLQKNLYHLRDKKLLHTEVSVIDSFTVTGEAGSRSFVRRYGTWYLGGGRIRAERGVVEGSLEDLTGGIIYRFVSEDLTDLERYGLIHPKRSINLHLPDADIEIVFGRTEENLVYATRSGLDKVVMVLESLAGICDLDDQHVQAMNLSLAPIDRVRSMTIDFPDTTLSLIRNGDTWSPVTRTDREILGNEVRSFMRMITGSRFTSIIREGADPALSAETVMLVTMEDSSGKPIDVVRISRPADGGEIGFSISTGVTGRLRDGHSFELRKVFNRIGFVTAAGGN